MRLDKYLKISRLIKRRSVGKQACDAGKVTVNGKVARASYDISINDVIAIDMGRRVLQVKVLDVKEHVNKEEAPALYQVISDEKKEEA